MAAEGGGADVEFLVLKFGGTSVSTAANWRRIAAIIKSRIAAGGDNLKIVVVHSALSGVTDKLQLCLEQVLERRRSSDTGNGPHDAQQPAGTHKRTLASIMVQHLDLSKALGMSEAEAQIMLAPYHQELKRILEGASLIGEVSSRTKARVVAMGELLSTTIGAAALSAMLPDGTSCWLEARELLRCAKGSTSVLLPEEQTYLSATCDYDPNPDLQTRLATDSSRVFVTQGFIASNQDGDTVLLGRGGSDTSAAYFAAKLEASYLEIWTDVPGMFTANPRLIPEAKLLCTLSFSEAQELASTGAKILHPRCIGPAAKHNIPIKICDTFRPQLQGTVITASSRDGGVVKAISVRHGITIVNLESLGMWQQAGFLADAFRAFKTQSISVDLVATSESTVTASIDPETVTEGALDRVSSDLADMCSVTFTHNCASISLVGQQIRTTLPSLAPALLAFRRHKVHMLTQAANDLNLTFVVDDPVADEIAIELHHNLIEQPPAEVETMCTYGLTWSDLSSPNSSPPNTPTKSSSEDVHAGETENQATQEPSVATDYVMRIGFVGWRGMVGSVLMERMTEEGDFDGTFEPVFFTTSQVGQPGPVVGTDARHESCPLVDATDLAALSSCAIIVSCQGGSYTESVHPKLRSAGWNGYWIDAASFLRTQDSAVIVLDPVNRRVIDDALAGGKIRDFVGGNCTVSLMLMALGGLFEAGIVEWVSSMTYQSASGAGARHMKELLEQMRHLGKFVDTAEEKSWSALELEHAVHASMRTVEQDDISADKIYFPATNFGVPLACSLLPFIDKPMEDGTGRSKEEWKGMFETNKILGRGLAGDASQPQIPVDGACVRVGALRCHSQAITLKLKSAVALDDVERLIRAHNEWVDFVPNTKEDTLQRLTPCAVAGGLTVAVGRVRRMTIGDEYLTVFTVGDQLLWGAAEPVRRALRIVLGHVRNGQ